MQEPTPDSTAESKPETTSEPTAQPAPIKAVYLSGGTFDGHTTVCEGDLWCAVSYQKKDGGPFTEIYRYSGEVEMWGETEVRIFRHTVYQGECPKGKFHPAQRQTNLDDLRKNGIPKESSIIDI